MMSVGPIGSTLRHKKALGRLRDRGGLARIGFLGLAFERTAGEWLRAGLRDLGHVEGTNIIIEWQWAEKVDQLPELAAELEGRPVRPA